MSKVNLLSSNRLYYYHRHYILSATCRALTVSERELYTNVAVVKLLESTCMAVLINLTDMTVAKLTSMQVREIERVKA